MQEDLRIEHELDITSAFFFPHGMLQRLAPEDAPEVRAIKIRMNKRWLKQWLPTYIARWFCIFLGSLLAWNLMSSIGVPDFIQGALIAIQVGSGITAAMFTGMLFNLHTE